mmetsp:Transcript_3334/g.8632  ORF Transcript_3334/g.8632 Transcript_3334/m.8632 type:complete len:119 (-) Transcript_3334:268-624(-)
MSLLHFSRRSEGWKSDPEHSSGASSRGSSPRRWVRKGMMSTKAPSEAPVLKVHADSSTRETPGDEMLRGLCCQAWTWDAGRIAWDTAQLFGPHGVPGAQRGAYLHSYLIEELRGCKTY